jgi:hypothetical protein
VTSDNARVDDPALCPRCAAPLEAEPGEAPWCERCEWGLDAVTPEGSRMLRPLRGFAYRLGFRRTMALYHRLEYGNGGGRWSRVLVLVLSLVVLGLTLGLIGLAGWLVLRYPNPFTVVAALLLLVVATVLLRQRSIRREAALWADRPPVGLRASLIETAPHQPPALVLTDAESDRIHAELATRYERCRRTIAQGA